MTGPSQAPVRWGIIGASPGNGWASAAHLPAVARLAEVDLVAVSTTRQKSADQAKSMYGARRSYASAEALLADPDVEAVTIAVRVPKHFNLVEAALEAGKHVYCEWPLTADTATATALRDLARHQGLETVVGLQAARSWPVDRVKEIVASGALGRVLSVTVRSTSGHGSATTLQDHAYLLDSANGANLLTITALHALDTLCAAAGEIAELSATLATRTPAVEVVETGEVIKATSPNQVALTGTLEGGAVFSAGVLGGLSYDHGFALEIRGEAGAVYLTAPSLTSADLTVHLIGRDGERTTENLVKPEGLIALPDGPPSFVGRLYLDLADAIRGVGRNGPDFGHAVRRHELIDAITESSRNGTRMDISPVVH